MNSTSLGSKFVRMAARSPGRSRTGPEVWRRLTPISRAMMCASVVLPSPGGPNSSTWSSASPRARAAWMKISSWPRIFSWPTYSARVAGRSERSNCSSCAEVGLAEISRSVSTLTPAFCPRIKRAAGAALFFWTGFSPLKAVNRPDAQHVDIRLDAENAASELGIPLPFAAHTDVPGDVVLHAGAVCHVGVGFLHAEPLNLAAEQAQFSINRKLIGDGP